MESQPIRRLVAGDSFGELSLASGEPRSASIVVTSETCSVLVASKRLMTASGFLTVINRKREEWGRISHCEPAVPRIAPEQL